MILKKQIFKEVCLALFLVMLSRLSYWFVGEVWNVVQHSNVHLFDLLCQWDADWYASIVKEGYWKEPRVYHDEVYANWGFFPLYPMLVSFFVRLTGLSVFHSGVVVSTLLLIVAIVFIIKYVSMTRDRSIAISAAILVAFGPYSFYFSSLYTESLFILLTVICFYYLEKEEWIKCGIFGALLSSTRPTGVLFVVPLLIKMVFPLIIERQGLFGIAKSILIDARKLLSLLLIPAGLFAYMTFLYFHVGDPFVFNDVQIAWGRVSGNPLGVLSNGLLGQGFEGWVESQYLSLWGLLGLVCSVYLFMQKRFTEGAFGLICILTPMMSSIMAMPRYFIGTIVLIFSLNDIINRFEKFKWPIIIILSAANILLLILWFSRHWITT